MVAKGRQRAAKGENNPSSKLTDSKVLQIKKMLASKNFTQWDIAKKFDIHQSLVSLIKLNKCWKHCNEGV
jgi:predicted XRE-type DNA-binding protein